MLIRVSPTPINGLVIIEPQVFTDHRGSFFEAYSSRDFADAGITARFLQDNESVSIKNVLRGLHFQAPPFAQSKLVRVARGSVIDAVVDIRTNSKTYGHSFSIELSAANRKMLFVPEGFAHGFLTLEDETIFSYKCSNYYTPSAEDGLMWNDPHFKINWTFKNPLLSAKDTAYKPFSEFKSPF